MLLLLEKDFIGIAAYLGHLALNKRQIQISNRHRAASRREAAKSAFSARGSANAKRLVKPAA